MKLRQFVAAAGCFAILAASAVQLARADDAQDAVVMNRLKQVGITVMMYANENKGWLPSSLGQTVKYTKSDEIYLTPASGVHAPQLTPDRTEAERAQWVDANSDLVLLTGGIKMTRIKRPYEVPMIVTRVTANSPDVFVVFVDGHVQRFAAKPPPPVDHPTTAPAN